MTTKISNLKQILTIAEKEMKLNLRFKFNYFFDNFFSSVRQMILFLLVYLGFFSYSSLSIGGLNKQNYIAFIILGVLSAALFYKGYQMFYQKFLYEKFWETFSGFFITPSKKINLIIGYCLADLVYIGCLILVWFVILYLIYPTGILNMIFVAILLLVLFFSIASFGLLYGIVAVSAEKYIFLFNLIMPVWIFFSCFYYPLEFIPKFLRIFVYLNPVYYLVDLTRKAWLGGLTFEVFAVYMIPILLFMLVMPLISFYLFDKIWKKGGIVGY